MFSLQALVFGFLLTKQSPTTPSSLVKHTTFHSTDFSLFQRVPNFRRQFQSFGFTESILVLINE